MSVIRIGIRLVGIGGWVLLLQIISSVEMPNHSASRWASVLRERSQRCEKRSGALVGTTCNILMYVGSGEVEVDRLWREESEVKAESAWSLGENLI